MAVRLRHASEPSDVGALPLTPDALTRQEFGRRLHKILLERRWNQSELARQAGMKRDSISAYINGKRWPTPASQKAMADALGTSVDELFPNAVMHRIDDEVPSFEMKVAAGHPGQAWVRVNRWMTMSAATKIAEILNVEDQRNVSPD